MRNKNRFNFYVLPKNWANLTIASVSRLQYLSKAVRPAWRLLRTGNHRHSLYHDLLDRFFTVFSLTLAAMTAAVDAVVGDQAFVAAGDMRGQQREKLRYRPVPWARLRCSGIHRHGLLLGMVVDSLDGQGSPAHAACQAFDGFPVGAVNGPSEGTSRQKWV